MAQSLKIAVIGGGPGGLYFSILMKKANPAHQITVYERNRPDDTFGFAVVFSDETLKGFMGRDEATYRAITDAFGYWDEIEVRYRDQRIRSGGHGFCGISRIELLNILQHRAQELGVDIQFETEIDNLEQFSDCDLILASDGVNSWIRETYKDKFKPNIDFRKTKFVWLGTTQTFDAFTFIFRENQHGWHYLHAYRMGKNQFGDQGSTWILECHEDTWRNAGFDKMSEEETVAYYQDMFKEELDGHPILANRSIWRNFPVVTNEHWHFDNVVLIGDACHTAQFSIGSGTKIAMEDAIALADAVEAHGKDVKAGLQAYEDARKDEVARLQRTALVSLSWYENARRYNGFEPPQYAFSFLTRSKSVTYENLKVRDPKYGADVDRWFAEMVRDQGFDVPHNDPPPPMFTPFRVGKMVVENRVVVSPMCQYSATDGTVGDWQLAHLGGFATGGAGLIFTEMTDVSPDGRISPGCAGMYKPEHVDAWKRVVDFVHANGKSKIGIQLGHAGRKASVEVAWKGNDVPLPADEAWEIIAPSPIPYLPTGQVPREMTRTDMDRVRDDFARAAKMADDAGFDILEIHMAHGYLLATFISPLTNKRTDEYGGSLENRMRFPLEVLRAVREAWPAEKPISVRISATDWAPGGMDGDEAVEVARMIKDNGADIIDVSAGQTVPDQEPIYGRMFQVPFSDQIRQELGVPTITVGNITTADQVNTILAAGRADLVALARPHLTDPHFTLHAAAHYGFDGVSWPKQYGRAHSQAMSVAQQENEHLAELREAAKPPSHRRQEAAE